MAENGTLKPGIAQPGRLVFEHGTEEQVSAHELVSYRRVNALGVDVFVRKRDDSTNGKKNPDTVMFDTSWEYKAPIGSSKKNTIDSQFKRAKKQSDHMVIDLFRIGFEESVALEQVRERFARTKSMKAVIALTADGTAHIFNRKGIH